MPLIIECTNCQGQVKIPDDFPGGEVGCAHCGTKLTVTVPGQPGPALARSGGAGHPHHPISPEEFRMMTLRKQNRRRIVKLVVVLVLIAGGLGYAVQRMTFGELVERTKAISRKGIEKVIAVVGGETKGDGATVVPVGSYETKSLPGLRGQTGDEGGWKIEEEGKTYFVVAMDVAQRQFTPGDEVYQEFVSAAEENKEEGSTPEVPSRDQCRVFDPKLFKLLMPGGELIDGALINISTGEFQGFYDSFRMVFPKGATEEEDKKQLLKIMDIEVAFVVDEGTDLAALKLEFMGAGAVAVPAP